MEEVSIAQALRVIGTEETYLNLPSGRHMSDSSFDSLACVRRGPDEEVSVALDVIFTQYTDFPLIFCRYRSISSHFAFSFASSCRCSVRRFDSVRLTSPSCLSPSLI